MSRYKRVEVKDPDAGLKLLGAGLEKALKELPTADNTEVVNALNSVRDAVTELSSQQRASQEASKAHSELLASAIASIELNVSQGSSEPLDVQPIVEALSKLADSMPTAQQMQEVPPVDVEGLVEKIFQLTNRERPAPTYNFKVERNHSGVLTGIVATPTTGGS